MVDNHFSLHSIGAVKADNGTFEIKLDGKYKQGLNGLEGFSHILVVWWAHMFATDEYREILEAKAPYTKGPDSLGIFATRSPVRPNPVAVSHVQVLAVDTETGVISVPYIDAEDGTPVLDIKPYHPSEDRIREAAVPSWCDHWPKWHEDSAEFDWNSEFNF